MQHHMFKLVMDGKLYHAPLQDPKGILDIGTGSGIWPIEMGMIVFSCHAGPGSGALTSNPSGSSCSKPVP